MPVRCVQYSGSGRVRFAGAAGSAAGSRADLMASWAGSWGAGEGGELDGVSDEDMPDDFRISGAHRGEEEGRWVGSSAGVDRFSQLI